MVENKVKESWTIDKNVSDWVRTNYETMGCRSPSECVTKIIKNNMGNDTDVFSKVAKIDLEIRELEQKRQVFLEQYIKILEDGNKKEREEVKKKLKEEEVRNKKQIERLQYCYNRLKELNLLERFNACSNDEDFIDLAKECMKINSIENKPLSSSVGVFEMKKLSDLKTFMDLENLGGEQ